MPLVDDPIFEGFAPTVPLLTPANFPVTPATPGLWDVISAEFETSNVVGSLGATESGFGRGWSAQPWDPDFDLIGSLKGTKWENDPERFVTARTRTHLEAMQRDIEREERNAVTIRNSSW